MMLKTVHTNEIKKNEKKSYEFVVAEINPVEKKWGDGQINRIERNENMNVECKCFVSVFLLVIFFFATRYDSLVYTCIFAQYQIQFQHLFEKYKVILKINGFCLHRFYVIMSYLVTWFRYSFCCCVNWNCFFFVILLRVVVLPFISNAINNVNRFFLSF